MQARWQVGEWETFAVIGLDEDGRRDYHQAGFRWSPQIGGLHWLAEYSHVEENKTLLGGDLSVWGWQGGAATEQGRLACKAILTTLGKDLPYMNTVFLMHITRVPA